MSLRDLLPVCLGLSVLLLAVHGSPTDRSSSRPQFSTEGRHFKVVEHNSVVLPCRVVNIGSHVRAWKRGIAVLTAGQVKVSPDERYRLVHGYDLEVQDVGPADEGEYTCQIATLTPQEVTHTLEILVPPKIEEVSGGGLVEARAGSQVTIDCRASGNPPPFLQWTRKTNRTLPGLKPMNGSSLLLGSVSRHQAGLYQCVASNGVGRPAFAELKLRVLYPPEVETEEPWVHTGVGSQAVLVCTVYAEPQAEVRWYRSALKLEVTDDHETERRGNRHRLIIRRVEAQDLDNYTCEAVNNLGKAKQSILLSGRPRAAVFRSGPLSRWRDSYNISWSVFSQSQLLEHRLFYRRRLIGGQLPSALLPERWGMNMSAWYGRDWTEVILQASYTDSVTQDMSYLITGLQPATQYEAKVKASNSFGWSQTSEAFLFTTRGLDGFSWESSQGSEEVILTPEKEIRDLGVILEDYSNSRSSISGIKYIYLDAALLLLMAYQNLELYL